MPADFVDALAALDAQDAAAILATLSDAELAQANCFTHWQRPGQAPPPTTPSGAPWRTWLIVAGRGFGKTRAGSEWILARAREGDAGTRIALVAGDLEEARRVMVEGPSGLLACAEAHEAIDYVPARRELRFPSGATATLYSGASPEMLRGPEHDFAWCDELAKWARAQETWDNLQLGLRRGPNPQAVVTTTPRAGSLVAALAAEPDCVVTGGGSRDNIFLPPAFLSAVERRYAGTRQGEEELFGRIVADVEGSLWPWSLIERSRVSPLSPPASGRGDSQSERGWAGDDPSTFTRIVIGVDPPASATGTCGIIAAAALANGKFAVLADESVTRASPETWASAVATAAERWGADRIVAERNQGGDMVAAVLRAAGRALPVKLVHAARGKSARAEPVAALFEQGLVGLAGSFRELEAELHGLLAGGGYAGPSTGSGGSSPDRADAMVWALTELALMSKAEPRVRRL